VSAEVGATRLGGGDGGADSSSAELTAGLGVGTRLRRLSGSLVVVRAPFDETARLIVNGLATTSVEADLELALPGQLALELDLGHAGIAGGTASNARTSTSGALRWTPRPAISLAAGGRVLGHARQANDGYFAPRSLWLAEASARVARGGALGLAIEGDAGLGVQSITPFGAASRSRMASRVAAAVAYRWAPGVEWRIDAGVANVASAATVSAAGYRVWYVGISGRVPVSRR
jgi:hypothetical protein